MKKLFYSMLVAVLAIGCSRSNDSTIGEEIITFDKSVTLSLSSETRAMVTSSNGPIAGPEGNTAVQAPSAELTGTQLVAISDITVLFANQSGEILNVYKSGVDFHIDSITREEGVKFKRLPSSVTTTYVVANTKTSLDSVTTATELKAIAHEISTQAAVAEATMFGLNTITKSSNTHIANVTLTPLISRLQVKVKRNSEVAEAKIIGVYVDKFFTTSTLDKKTSDFKNNTEFAADYYNNMYSYNAQGFNMTANETGYVETNKVFGYSFFPTSAPELVVKYLYNLNGKEVTRYTRASFPSKTDWSVANLYNVELALDRGTVDPNETSITVTVKVTVQDWSTVTLKPEYN
ncbi:MAG: hypothetical protein ACRDDZ_05075 [Marinifilaceae bacterium]